MKSDRTGVPAWMLIIVALRQGDLCISAVAKKYNITFSHVHHIMSDFIDLGYGKTYKVGREVFFRFRKNTEFKKFLSSCETVVDFKKFEKRVK